MIVSAGRYQLKNKERWEPSKYIYRDGRLIASRDPKKVNIGSRLISDVIAEYYDINIKKYVNGKLLDLGCGEVPLYATYKDHITENICLDWENTCHKINHLDFTCDINRGLPFENGEFETIILSDVLEHVPEPLFLLSEIYRVLSTDGVLLLNVPFYYWIHEQPYDYYRYTEFALRRFVESSGLKLVFIKSIGGVPEILADIIAKNVSNLRIIGRPISSILQKCVFMFIKSRYGKKVSKGSGKKFPLGYFLVARKL